MDHLIEKIKDEKVSIGVVICFLAIAYYSHGWVFDTFVTKAEAAAQTQQIADTLHEIQNTLNKHVADYDIKEAVKDVEKLETELWHLELHEKESGATPETTALRAELNKKLGHAIAYRDCLLANLPNCEHLNGR